MKKINVLSLFDGMSCGQIALKRAEIEVNNYYASEIDKHAISVTQHNYPNTIQVGSVIDLKASNLPKIDLIIGGSPCQSFSNARSNNSGFDGKSGLFWEFVRVLNEAKPTYFLLENVMMKKEWEDVITDAMGVEPIQINSDLFSAQSRSRLYWTNIPVLELPVTNNDLLSSILEQNVDPKYFYEQDFEFYGNEKVVCAKLNINGHDILKRVNSTFHKCQTLTAVCGGNQQKKIIDDKKNKVRKLTPKEYERLQTIPDDYTSIVSDGARYKMLGNGWTVDVIAHIFKGLK